MRIIRLAVLIGLLALGFFAQKALGAEKEEGTNETKINFKIQENINFEMDGIIMNQKTNLLALAPYTYSSYTATLSEKKTAEDLEREKKLARFSEKRKAANYPKGKFTINASAYTAAADECGKSDGITASGVKVREQETLACPSQFPFGTKLSIEGLGTYVCQDRGGAIKGNHIDIYMKTKSEAFAFGRRNLEAEVVF
jgi:3D (Asp-Asp-Asp) domain-containing protein